MKPSLNDLRDATHEAVSQITGWCILIANHQKYGIGRDRHERVGRRIETLRREYLQMLAGSSTDKAFAWLKAKLPKGTVTEFRVPLNRWAKNRREEQLRMAGDRAATLSWLIWAASVHEELGYGAQRLNGLREEALANYRQFNAWCCEDKDWAFDKLRRCAEAATREKMVITDEPDTTTVYLADDGLREEDRRAVRLAVTQMMAEKQRPAGWAVLNQQKLMTNIQNEVQFYDQSLVL